ncbi:MAG: CapA family protein, partial [Candidatus Cloacimonadota bacterium]|nr:CapA family protein [Candidatus Cloacimonadota bacterium]
MKFVYILLLLLTFALVSAEMIVDFEDDNIEFSSYLDLDVEPEGWALENEETYPNSSQSLHLSGNTWKVLEIEERLLNPNSVWSAKVNVTEYGQIQGIGFQDSLNTLLYSLEGVLEMDTQVWVADYQGAFPQNNWNEILLPIAADWHARFDYLPTIESIVFLNANTYYSDIYFDDIEDITEDINFIPNFEITYRIMDRFTDREGNDRAELSFFVTFANEPEGELDYSWRFGDGDTSIEPNPIHNFIIRDDHEYNVILEVTNNQNRIKYGACIVEISPGESSLPITMNFVGDILLDRGIEEIIENHPNEPDYIFQHVRQSLESSDLCVANLETPLTNSNTEHPTKGICFKANPDYAENLSLTGIDIVSIANNHIYDFMEEGIADTR